MKLPASLATPALALTCALSNAASPATPADQAFVAKVSQGGMFEVAAGKLAARRASQQDVRDFAAAEVHDHTAVGEKLAKAAHSAGITFSHALDADFQGKLAALDKPTGHDFDVAYMKAMAEIHDLDGAAFATEGKDGTNEELKDFANETHAIVLRHIGAIKAAPPSGD